MSADGHAAGAHHGAFAAAARWRLPFSRQAWRGLAGNWLGAGAGSSLDFQDHRAYVPGDDPRHIHWQAYARTGALTMKLYRAEVAPFVDVAVDVSESMAVTPEKQRGTDELVAFCVASADRAGAPVRVHAADGRALRAIAVEEIRAGRWRARLQRGADEPGGPTFAREARKNAAAVPASLALATFPWRPGALKVLISDLLFAGEPSLVLVPLAAGAGISVVLSPALADEAELPWRGNIDLVDCESGAMRRQRVDEPLAQRYRAAYARHFALWREACRRRGVLFGRVPCHVPLATALGGEAFSGGAVEVVA